MTITKLVTHNGRFHADEVLATVILKRLFPEAEVVRSRAPSEITPNEDRIIYDVGLQFDPDLNIFDHHQQGCELRPDDVPYSSFGLIWRQFGQEFLAKIGCPDEGLHAKFDGSFVLPIDLVDTGRMAPGAAGALAPLTFPEIIDSLMPGYDNVDPQAEGKAFEQAVALADVVVLAKINSIASKMRAAVEVRAAIEAQWGSPILELPRGMSHGRPIAEMEADHILFVVNPRGAEWTISGVRIKQNEFPLRRDLPAEWAGLSGEALNAVIGINDGIFCHSGRFMAAAGSRDSIMKMAALAVEREHDLLTEPKSID